MHAYSTIIVIYYYWRSRDLHEALTAEVLAAAPLLEQVLRCLPPNLAQHLGLQLSLSSQMLVSISSLCDESL
jgi:hypothetical protein